MQRVREKRLRSGELYAVEDGRRYKLADCEATIEVYESEHRMTLKGRTTEYMVKSCRAVLVICDGLTCTRRVDVAQLEQVSEFDIKLFFPREDGAILEKVFFDIAPKTIDLNGKWAFDVTGHMDEIRELFPDLIFG